MLGAVPMASTWLACVIPGSFTPHIFSENPTLDQVLGRAGGVHSPVGRESGMSLAWQELVFFDPCGKVAGLESGVSEKLPSRPHPGLAQTSRKEQRDP